MPAARPRRPPGGKVPRAATRDEPRERSTATRGPDPGELIRVTAEELAEHGEVHARDAPGALIDPVAVAEGQDAERFADRRTGNGEVGAGVLIALDPLRLSLDDPSEAQAAQAQGLREIADDSCPGSCAADATAGPW